MTAHSIDFATAARLWVRSKACRSLGTELTARHIALLAILCDEPGPHHVRALAKMLDVAKPIITRAHAKLEPLGLVKTSSDPRDRRSCIVSATAAGHALRQAMGGLHSA